ncbi:hypothetical protein [Chitinimonas sp. BJB300]|uniref:hypothetical protein n=1 Tax=Chitinimonas sp. BJB300 TaxID=1559339 RepID=UPI000C0DAB97|nr:hypothetical protein [Chitinimonas sp. BJB300]PHV10497.1 hypothetical protein CSQ89_15935 [Chitinimonas sp. BJB300]TSJ89878.1 hypothetical protein FG002_006630 [Chitinimonas sp. BJB300]
MLTTRLLCWLITFVPLLVKAGPAEVALRDALDAVFKQDDAASFSGGVLTQRRRAGKHFNNQPEPNPHLRLA